MKSTHWGSVLLKTSVRYFKAVVEAGSIRAASKNLLVNQAAISRQIQLLEDEIGLPVFERHARGVRLTQAGDRLAECVRDIDFSIGNFVSDIDAMRGLARGSVRLYSVETLVENLVPRVLDRFAAEFPGIHFEVVMESSDSMPKAILEGHADIALSFSTVPTGQVEKVTTQLDPMVALLSCDHPLAALPVLTLNDIAEWPLGVTRKPTRSRLLLDEACRIAGLSLQPAFETNSMLLLHKFAASGYNISVTNQLALSGTRVADHLVAKQYSEAALNSGAIEVLVLKGRRLPMSVQAALNSVLEELDWLTRQLGLTKGSP